MFWSIKFLFVKFNINVFFVIVFLLSFRVRDLVVVFFGGFFRVNARFCGLFFILVCRLEIVMFF